MILVFISSVVKGFEEYRQAAKEAIESVGMRPVMVNEDFSSCPDSPEVVCTKGVRESDIFISILGERYGYEVSPGVSASKAEYLEAKSLSKDSFAFAQTDVKMEDKQVSFKKEIEDYHDGIFRDNFSTPGDLKRRIKKVLSNWKDNDAKFPDDSFKEEIRHRLEVIRESHASTARVVVAFWGERQSLKSSEIEAEFKKFFKLHDISSGYNSPTRDEYGKLTLITYPKGQIHDSCSQVRYYDDGLILFRFSPPTKNFYYGITNYILPEKFELILKTCFHLNSVDNLKRGHLIQVFVRLCNKTSYFDKPLTEESRTPPLSRQDDDAVIEEWKTFNPMRKGHYERWIDSWIEKVRIKFGSQQPWTLG